MYIIVAICHNYVWIKNNGRNKVRRNKKYIVFMLLSVISIMGSLLFTGCNCKKKCGETNTPIIEPIYYYVTFESNNGSNSSMVRVESGKTVSKPSQDPIKEGYTFLYWAIDDVEYHFEQAVTSNFTLVAKYASNQVDPPKTSRVIWNEDEAVKYVFDGNVPRTVEVGTTIQFKLMISPFYEGDLKVTVNNKEITKNEKDEYVFIVEDVSLINVSVGGLTKQDDKIKGMGTETNPYRISNAAQFKAFVDGVNSTTDSTYNKAYITLETDLDFNGYELDVIGNNLNANEFSGYFDGKNHTISNFTIKASKGLFGLFGYLVVGELKNLNIESDLVCVTSSEYYNLIGAFVAYNIGSDIYNCHFNGSLQVENNLAKSAEVYVGGIVGYMQSYTNTNTAGLGYSSSIATISSVGTTEVTSQGGLVGLLFGSDVSVPAYIYNSSFDGNVEGLSLVSGGIVGTLSEGTSVAQCYSTGKVEATSATRPTSAGAIVGLAENETVVSYSFSTSTIFSSNPNEAEYNIGIVVGGSYKDGTSGIDDRKVLEIENYYSPNGAIQKDGKTYQLTQYDDVIALLKWNSDDWNANLTPNYVNGEQSEFTVNFDFGRNVTKEGLDGTLLTQKTDNVKLTGYLPIYWVYDGSGMNTFVADDGTISYGYYLDEQRTIRVPSSFILTQATTIYVGFADYSNVIGEYYVSLHHMEIRLRFDDNGKMEMYYDGMISNYMYVFDGNRILIKEGYFAYIEYPSLSEVEDLDIDYYAEVKDDQLIIYNNKYFPKEDGLEIVGNKRSLAMGVWYSKDNKEYTFFSDGTGNIDQIAYFKYECNDHYVVITLGKEIIYATISNDLTTMEASNGEVLSITRYDEFLGVWESEYVYPDEIRFDGRGNVVYQNTTYSYVVDASGRLTFGDYVAYFNDSGLLVLEQNGKNKLFGRTGSYMGTWTDTILDYWVILEGINKDGYGYGYDSYGFTFTYVEKDATEEERGLITMYVGTKMYGYGSMVIGKDGSHMLYLAVYTPTSGMIVDDYNACYIDPFLGTWNGADGLTLSFNGLGAYDIYEYIHTLQQYWDVRGFVTIEENGITSEVRYQFDRDLGTGSFVYKGITYHISIDNGKLVINDQVYQKPDGLETYQYQVDDMVITFNGKSNVNLGSVIIRQNGIDQMYRYQYIDNVVSIYEENELVYTLTIGDQYEFVDMKNNKTDELGIYHRLIGNTYVISATSQFEFCNPFDIKGMTKAIFRTKEGAYEVDVRYIDQNYIALYMNGSFIYYAFYLDENCAALCDQNFKPISVIAKADELRGSWQSEDGEKLIFSGLSKASKYTTPYCQATEQDDIEVYLEDYTYEKVEEYYVIVSIENGIEVEKYIVYTTYVENATVYKQGDQTIYVVTITD